MEQQLDLISRMPRNMWRTWGRMNFPIDGLALYLPLWHPELKGSTILSKDLNAHSCTVTGATWGSTGRSFNGTSDYIAVAHNSALTLTTVGTVMVWLKWDGTADKVIQLVKGASGDFKSNNYFIIMYSNTIKAGIGDGVAGRYVTTATLPTVNVWTHVVLRWDGSNIYLGYNNVQVGTISQLINGAEQVTSLYIGAAAVSAEYSKGIIGEVWIYNRALSALEIQHNYLATKWRYS